MRSLLSLPKDSKTPSALGEEKRNPILLRVPQLHFNAKHAESCQEAICVRDAC